jgi:hypothetical protein
VIIPSIQLIKCGEDAIDPHHALQFGFPVRMGRIVFLWKFVIKALTFKYPVRDAFDKMRLPRG